MRLLLSILCLASACGKPPVIVVEPLEVVSWMPNRGAACVTVLASAGSGRTDPVFAASVTFSDYLDASTVTPDSLFVRPEGGEPLAVLITTEGRSQSAGLGLTADL